MPPVCCSTAAEPAVEPALLACYWLQRVQRVPGSSVRHRAETLGGLLVYLLSNQVPPVAL